ncbi:MAG: hypothetical protein COA69_03325 [Robiginitomaculum sp.]|nr:MAG: hypothetical protein COA69_03325 [Robiginitomaculum sp.]
MKIFLCLAALALASCTTADKIKATDAPNGEKATVEFDSKTEKLLGERIGYIFASPEKVATRIGREFAAFDSDYSGELSAYEFSKWLIPLHELRYEFDEAPMTISDEDLQDWSKGAHAFADTDRNGEVSQAELTRYFGGL